jgi:hypothetical protein
MNAHLRARIINRRTLSAVATAVWRDHTGSALRIIVTLASLATLLHSYVLTYQDYAPVAFWDLWNWVEDLQRYYAGQYHLADLFNQHNEHRIATTRVFLFVDSLFFHMTGRFVVIANMVLLAVTGALTKYLVRNAAIARTNCDMPTLFYIACFTSFCQWDNLTKPFQIQFVLTILFIMLAATLLALATQPSLTPGKAAQRTAIAAGSYALAVFSMASGVLAIAPLGLLLVLRRTTIRVAAQFLVPAVICIGLFFYRYRALPYPPLNGQHDPYLPLHLLLFVGTFVGGALSVYGAWAYIVGLLGLILLSISVTVLIYRRYVAHHVIGGRSAILGSLCCYVALCACSATLARFGMGGVEAATAGRYSVLSILFAVCLSGLLLQDIANSASVAARYFLWSWLPACVALIGLAAINFSPTTMAVAAQWQINMTKDAEGVRRNVDYDVPKPVIYWDSIDKISSELDFLRSHRLNLFAPAYDVPQSVRNRLIAAQAGHPATCTGALETAFRLDFSRMVLGGWIANPGITRTADWIGLADGAGNLIDAFSPEIKRKSIRKAHHLKKEAYGFDRAFGGLPEPGGAQANLHMVALFNGSPGESCVLNVPLMASSVIVQPLPATVAPITASRTETTASFIPGAAPDAKLLPPWPNTAFISTSAAGDAATGRATYQATWIGADDTALLVPFASGPDPAGQSLRFIFADGMNFSMPLPAFDPNQRWRVAALPGAVLRQHGGAVSIIADDAGTGWGQWIGIANPVIGRIAPDAARLYHCAVCATRGGS